MSVVIRLRALLSFVFAVVIASVCVLGVFAFVGATAHEAWWALLSGWQVFS